jgi:hypothetical protein
MYQAMIEKNQRRNNSYCEKFLKESQVGGCQNLK